MDTNNVSKVVELSENLVGLVDIGSYNLRDADLVQKANYKIKRINKELAELVGPENVDKARDVSRCISNIDFTIDGLERMIEVQKELKDRLSKQIDDMLN